MASPSYRFYYFHQLFLEGKQLASSQAHRSTAILLIFEPILFLLGIFLPILQEILMRFGRYLVLRR